MIEGDLAVNSDPSASWVGQKKRVAWTCVWTGDPKSPKEEWFGRWCENMLKVAAKGDKIPLFVLPWNNGSFLYLGNGQAEEWNWMKGNTQWSRKPIHFAHIEH